MLHTQAADWVTRFASDMDGILAPETLMSYRRKLVDFLRWWNTHFPQSPLDKDLAVHYTRALQKSTTAHRTQSLTFAILRRWASYLVREKQLPANPWQDITPPRRAEDLATQWLTFPEITRLLNSCSTDRQHLRNRLLCRLILKTGARETELSLVQYKDMIPLDSEGREALLNLPSKGKRTVEPVLLVQSLKTEIDAYFNLRFKGKPIPPETPFFVTIRGGHECPLPPRQMRRLITDALRCAGIKRPGITPLSLRHTAGKEAHRQKSKPEAIQAMLRHEDIRTTQRLLKQTRRWRTAAERSLSHY